MKRLFGILAIGGMMLAAAPTTGAVAASLINPATSASTALQLDGTGATEVRWGWHRHHWRRHHHHRHHWRRHHHHRRYW